MNKLECINAFITIVEAGSFVLAAKKLQVSTAAISRQMTTLERTLDVQLLHRTTRSLSLTEIGQGYYQQCKQTLAALQSAEDAISGSKKEATGLLHVVSSRYFAEKFILPRLMQFMQRNPKLKIKFEVAERFPDFSQEEVDLIFGTSIEGADHLKRKQVASTRYVLCASESYLKKHGTPQTPLELTQHSYITHSMREPDNHLVFDGNKEVTVNPVLYLNDSRAMCHCAIQGLGIVRLHDYIVSDALSNHTLIEILPEFNQTRLPVFLYYQPSRYLQPKIRKFIDFYSATL